MKKRIIALLILCIMLLSTFLPTVNAVLVENDKEKTNTITNEEEQSEKDLQEENLQQQEEMQITSETSNTMEMSQVQASQEKKELEIVSGEYKYKENTTGIEISKYTGNESNLVIPQKIDGKEVTSIGDGAFENCTSLTKLDIPSNIKIIGEKAFAFCSNLQEVNLNEGVEEINGGAFTKTAIKSITIPTSLKKCSRIWLTVNFSLNLGDGGPFGYCDNLVEAKLKEGMTEIPENLFSGSKSLKKVNIPKTITKINKKAFVNCTSLTKLDIPSNIKIIGEEAFAFCSNLQEVNLNEGIEEINAGAFSKTAIKSITIPTSLKKCSSAFLELELGNGGPFAFCDNLVEAKLKEGMTEIPENLFLESKSLKEVNIPKTITKINKKAFMNCSSLETVIISDNIHEIGKDAFGETNAIIMCNKYTDSIKTLIDQDVNIEIASDIYKDTEDKAIVKEQSEYNINFNSFGNNYVPVKIKYSIKQDMFDKISDKKIKIKLPKNMEVYTSGVYLDSQIISKYSIDNKNNIMTIPVQNQTGLITFNLNTNSNKLETPRIQSYAELTYNINNTQYSDLIEVIIENDKLITIEAPEKTNQSTVNVCGIGTRGQNVTISVDGQKDIIVKTSDITGRYSANIKINNSLNNYENEIIAKTEDGKGFAKAIVVYNEQVPEIKSFIMNYKAHGDNTIDLLEYQNKIKTMNYYPKCPPSFELTFDNAEYIDKLYVVSTKNNTKKYLEATYNPSTKKYYASGFFDENNINFYTPGDISYEYTLKKDEKNSQANLKVEDTLIYKAVKDAQNKNNLNLKKVETSLSETKGTQLLDKANIKYENAEIEEYEITYGSNLITDNITDSIIYKTFNIYETQVKNLSEADLDLLNTEFSVIDTVSKFGEYFTKDGKLAFNVDFSDPYNVTSFIYDTSSNTLLTYTFQSLNQDSPICDMFEDLNTISPLFKIAKNYYGLDSKKDELYKKIMGSDMTEDEKRVALECAERLDILRRVDYMFATTLTILGMSDETTFKLINSCHDLIFETMFSFSEEVILGEHPELINFLARTIGSVQYFINWLIDPSGYVYEGVSSNRLKGVKCTIYYKQNENSKPILWNAQDYEQENPLYTDLEGKYAWDVPEGLWQVKYEKQGYETAYSEWLPVPPPQTEVNIGLVSKAEPNISYINCYKTYIDMKFDKYMYVDSLNSKSIILKDESGNNISYSIEYINAEANETNKLLVTEIRLKPLKELQINKNYKVTVNNNALSYANVAMKESTTTLKALEIPEMTVSSENVFVGIGESKTVNLTFKNIKSGTVKCILTNDVSISVPKTVAINNGKASVEIKGEMNGNSLITFEIENTDICQKIYVSSGNNKTNIIDIANENVSLNKDQTFKLHPIIYPTTLEQKFKFSSNNKAVAEVDSNGVIKALSDGVAIITISSLDGKSIKEILVTCYTNEVMNLGDIDKDGEITSFDAYTVLEKSLGGEELTQEEISISDIDKDGQVTSFDAYLILSYSTGIIDGNYIDT